ncbi:MAG: hypothetical protein IPK53_07335 [bacterium]|nr:hypothetical protein [bacterium]
MLAAVLFVWARQMAGPLAGWMRPLSFRPCLSRIYRQRPSPYHRFGLALFYDADHVAFVGSLERPSRRNLIHRHPGRLHTLNSPA